MNGSNGHGIATDAAPSVVPPAQTRPKRPRQGALVYDRRELCFVLHISLR